MLIRVGHLGLRLGCICILCLWGVHAGAQIPPLFIGTSHPITDEFGVLLQGCPQQPPEARDRVEVHLAWNGQVDPPGTDGAPTTNNPVVERGVTTIGNQIAIPGENSGLFAVGFPERLPVGSRLFVRAFNAPTLEEASFYSDSAVMEIGSNPDAIYDVVLSAMQPLDSGDEDGDGLNNSLEKSLRSNSRLADTDGDGMSDFVEYRCGTDLNDAASFLHIRGLHFDADGQPEVLWLSSSGKHYQVECVVGDLAQPAAFAACGPIVTAAGAVMTNRLSGAAGPEKIIFRIRLVEE